MATLSLSAKQIAQLKSLHKELPEKQEAYRINAIILLASGLTIDKTAEYLLLSSRTVNRILDDYRQGGIDLVLETNYQGGQSKMSVEQEEALCKYLDENIVSTAFAAVTYVKQEFGLDYTSEGMVITLHRLGYSYKKTKIRPAKADKEKQETFVKIYEELKASLKKEYRLYFADATHPTHNVHPAYAWIRRGEEREVKSNTGRQRININGAYCPQDQSTIINECDTVNSQSTIELYQKIEMANPESGKIYVIRDNAKYYCSAIVKEYLKTSRIIEIPLPTYSPNLNLIERLWKYFKKKVLANVFYGTFDEFKGAVQQFFENIKDHSEALATLMTERFHIFQPEKS